MSFFKLKGRGLFYPYMASGLGNGPLVELLDGSVKYDMITGIGVHFFGHSHEEFTDVMVDALPMSVMQGNLQPGIEQSNLIEKILSHVGSECRLNHAWLVCSGTMANEMALKIVRQKNATASKILAFEHCFSGRSTAMQEITDNSKYRQGQPTYGFVDYLPFYDSEKGLQWSVDNTLKALKKYLSRNPDGYAALMVELVQGEGGFSFAPKEFYKKLFEEVKKSGLAVWVDEVQTFGRTGELFAYQTFELEKYVDIVTVGKLLQACMVLYTDEYNPKPGLVAGTFSGSTVALKSALKTLDILTEKGFLGKEGKINNLSKRFREGLEKLAKGSCKNLIGEIRAIGGMVAFEPMGGTAEDVKKVLFRLYENHVIAFSCGHGPYFVRMLPPFGAMEEFHVDEVCVQIEKTLLELSEDNKKG